MKKIIYLVFLISTLALSFSNCGKKGEDVKPTPTPTINSIGADASGAKGFPRQIFKIAGANLDGAKVFFKNASGTDAQASIHSNTATEIYAFVPETAVTGAVRIETPNGQASTNFTVRTVTVSEYVNGVSAPNSIAIHSSGRMYIARNSGIARYNPATLSVSTFVGSATTGYVDATGGNARFESNLSLAVDENENIYVADYGNHRIRKVTSAGVVTTLAGSTQGNTDGTGTVAKFDYPNDLTLVGNFLYVAENNNNRIRKIDITTGVVTTFVTEPIGGSSTRPAFVDADADGTLYVSTTAKTMTTVSASGVKSANPFAGITTGTGTYTDAFPATSAEFNQIGDIAVVKSGAFKGGVFVTEKSSNTIRFVFEGVSTVAGELPANTTGGYVNGSGIASKFKAPTGIACDATGSTLYVADTQNNRIRKIVISD